MENPFFTLEYNSRGSLSKVIEMREEKVIEYNDNDLPISISTYDMEYDTQNPYFISNFEWDEDGFTNIYGDKFLLDSDGQIKSKIELTKNSVTQIFDTVAVIDNIWTATDKLKRVCTFFSPYSKENNDWEENYSFSTGHSPFTGINIALLVSSVVECSEWVEPQNIYCTTNFSDKYFSASISYEFNEDKFPIKADIKYTSEEGVFHDYVYFEYEPY